MLTLSSNSLNLLFSMFILHCLYPLSPYLISFFYFFPPKMPTKDIVLQNKLCFSTSTDIDHIWLIDNCSYSASLLLEIYSSCSLHIWWGFLLSLLKFTKKYNFFSKYCNWLSLLFTTIFLHANQYQGSLLVLWGSKNEKYLLFFMLTNV